MAETAVMPAEPPAGRATHALDPAVENTSAASELVQWAWADSWAVPAAICQWSHERRAQDLAAELDAVAQEERPVLLYNVVWRSKRTFPTPASAAEGLRTWGPTAAVSDALELDFAKPPAITGIGDMLALGVLSLTVPTVTTIGLALSPILLARHLAHVAVVNIAEPSVRSCCSQRSDAPQQDRLFVDDVRDSDRHWERTLRVRRFEGNNQPMKFPEGVARHATYLRMSDGVEIAVDILLPPRPDDDQRPVPCVVQFARYYRAFEIRWPLRSLINDGEPWDFMHGETKSELLLAGFAWVSADVRGCGASSGVQDVVWNDREVEDMLEVIDFIVGTNTRKERQPWSDGRVAVFGVSYDAGVALRAAARGHPALQAVVAAFPFGDIWRELFPGGIMNRWFLETWSTFNRALDTGTLVNFHPAAPVAVKGAAPAGPREKHNAAVDGHKDNWDLMGAADELVGIDSPVTLRTGTHISAQVLNLWMKHVSKTEVADPETSSSSSYSPEAVFPTLGASGVPVLLFSGWLCITAPTVLQAFAMHARPGWRMVVGPWNHGGTQHVRYGRGSRTMHFPFAADAAAFLTRHIPVNSRVEVEPEGRRRDPPEVHYYIGGASPGWVHGDQWPPQAVTKRPLWLTVERTLTPTAPGPGEKKTTQLPRATGASPFLWEGNSRYVAMIKAMDLVGHAWCAPPPDTFALFQSGPLEEAVTVAGSPFVSLHLRSASHPHEGTIDHAGREFLRAGDDTQGSAQDADIFAYLCVRSPGAGTPVYLTEGQLRLSHRAETDPPPYVDAVDPPVEDEPAAMAAAAVDFRHGKAPFHGFIASEVQPLPPADGSDFHVRIPLLPLGYRFEAGCCIVLILVGDDAAHFAPNPALAAAPRANPPCICHGSEAPSLLWLPVLSPSQRSESASLEGMTIFPAAY